MFPVPVMSRKPKIIEMKFWWFDRSDGENPLRVAKRYLVLE